MTAEMRATHIAEAKRLLLNAISILDSGSFHESAVWRIADAGGHVVAALTEGQRHTLCGLKQPTGLGNLLVTR